MSVYNNNIPKPTDFLSDSQQQLLNNFAQLDVTMAVNHYNFSDNTIKNGKHKFVELVAQSLPTTLSGEGSLYSNTAGQTQLFYTSDAGAQAYQMTRAIDASISLFATNTNYPQVPPVADQFGGWTFLPGGLLLQYGIGICAAKNTATTFKYPIAFTSVPFSITIGNITGEGDSPGENNQFIKDGTVTATQFQIVNSSSSSARKIYWQAIGK